MITKEDNLNLIKPAFMKITDKTGKYLYGTITTETIDENAKFQYYPFFYKNYDFYTYVNNFIENTYTYSIYEEYNKILNRRIVKSANRSFESYKKIKSIDFRYNLQYYISFANLSKDFENNNAEINTANFNINLENYLSKSDEIFNFLNGEFSVADINDINFSYPYLDKIYPFDNLIRDNTINSTLALLNKLINKRFRKYGGYTNKRSTNEKSYLTLEEFSNSLTPTSENLEYSRVIDNDNGNFHKVTYSTIKFNYLKSLDELNKIYNEQPIEIIIFMPVAVKYDVYIDKFTSSTYDVMIPIPIGVYKLYDKNNNQIKFNAKEITTLSFDFYESKKYNAPVGQKIVVPFYNAVGTFGVHSTKNVDSFLLSIKTQNTLFKNLQFYPAKFNPHGRGAPGILNYYTSPLTSYINNYIGYNLTTNQYSSANVYNYLESALQASTANVVNQFTYLDNNDNINFAKEYSIVFDKLPEYIDVPITYLYCTVEGLLIYVKFDEPIVSEYSFPITLNIRLDSGY